MREIDTKKRILSIFNTLRKIYDLGRMSKDYPKIPLESRGLVCAVWAKAFVDALASLCAGSRR